MCWRRITLLLSVAVCYTDGYFRHCGHFWIYFFVYNICPIYIYTYIIRLLALKNISHFKFSLYFSPYFYFCFCLVSVEIPKVPNVISTHKHVHRTHRAHKRNATSNSGKSIENQALTVKPTFNGQCENIVTLCLYTQPNKQMEKKWKG